MAVAEAQGLVFSSSVVLAWWCFDTCVWWLFGGFSLYDCSKARRSLLNK
jgi:hypothetical protein